MRLNMVIPIPCVKPSAKIENGHATEVLCSVPSGNLKSRAECEKVSVAKMGMEQPAGHCHPTEKSVTSGAQN